VASKKQLLLRMKGERMNNGRGNEKKEGTTETIEE
jgi:hypothetical protein